MTTTNTPFEEAAWKILDDLDLRVDEGQAYIHNQEEIIESLTQLHEAALLAELEQINKANIDNGINFYFEDMKDKSDGWRTMRQYIPERIAALQRLGSTS